MRMCAEKGSHFAQKTNIVRRGDGAEGGRVSVIDMNCTNIVWEKEVIGLGRRMFNDQGRWTADGRA